jgi:hypothetical protein
MIAVCSVLHHQEHDDAPPRIIGRITADQLQYEDDVPLSTPLKNPVFEIYRGTLGDLNLFNLNENRFFEDAGDIGISWNVDRAGYLEAELRRGHLPETVNGQTLSDIAETFCLCRVPDGSDEQEALMSLLFGLRAVEAPPEFSKSNLTENGIRVASWRMLLEIIAMSPQRELTGEFLMARLLEQDVLEMQVSPPVRKVLLLWRWVAARAFFERGWTQIFRQTFRELKKWPLGIDDDDLRSNMRAIYSEDQTLNSLSQEVNGSLYATGWLTDRFRAGSPRDSLLLLVAGIIAAANDERLDPALDVGQLSDIGEVRTSSEKVRYVTSLEEPCREYWADTVMGTLSNHFRVGLRKLRRGNPDSLYVDYENGRWMVPTKALRRDPGPSLASGRLDVALG